MKHGFDADGVCEHPEEPPWYAERCARWKPERVALLLIGESAPATDGVTRRFFYDIDLTRHDGLFREVVRSMYPGAQLTSGAGAKEPWLQRLKEDGVYLIDLTPAPVNHLDAGERAAALRSNVGPTVAAASSLEPASVILIKRNVFEMLSRPLVEAGLSVLNDDPLPFPGSGQQKRFREMFGRLLLKATES